MGKEEIIPVPEDDADPEFRAPVIREFMPSDEVARETRLAAQGYILSVEKTAVLGYFAGTYFMRSKQGASPTLRVDQTPIGRLEREWRKFRLSALG